MRVFGRSGSLKAGLLAAGLSGMLPGVAVAAPSIVVERHAPCNLFEPKEEVAFQAQIKGLPAGDGQLEGVVTDYDGKEAWKETLPLKVEAGKPTMVALKIGKLQRGYYDLKLKVSVPGADGKPIEATGQACLGVMDFVNRTAAEVREGGYAFGLKWWGGVKHAREDLDAMVKLGLQWTRLAQAKNGPLTTEEILTQFPMNAAIKVERFPKELYDEERYGPLEAWEKEFGKGAWTLKTLPKKAPYQEFVRADLAKIPAEQLVFEIWNEAWDKLAPGDFAVLSQWIAEVILKERPNAIIGPNLKGNTSPFEYDALVIKAGGLKHMKMVALHPYAGSEDRQWLKDYRQWLKEQTGVDMEIYVTEFGSHSTPEGPSKRTEQEQARRTVRQAIALFAGGVKAFMPHWLGQTEENPTYIEDWFGFLRKNEEPKPVLLAYANAARVIDGSRYAGDLWYGPRVEAMLFDQKGSWVLALWTLNDTVTADGGMAEKEIEVEPGVSQVTLVDMIGREQKQTVTDGKLKVKVGEAPVYLVGVSPKMAELASLELRADRWPQPEIPPRITRTVRKLQSPPALDGKFEDWKGSKELSLVNPKVAGMDCSGIGYLGWDDQYLYVGVNIRDNEMLNKQARSKLYRQDSVELFVSTEPRDKGTGFGPNDRQFFLTPVSGEGGPILGEVTDREGGKVEDIKGVKSFSGKTALGWAIEAAIPWSALGGFKPEKGAKLALDLLVNDADTSHERFTVKPEDSAASFRKITDPSSWSLMLLEE